MEEISQLSEGNKKVVDEKKLIDNKDISAHTDLTIGDIKIQGNDKLQCFTLDKCEQFRKK